MSLALEEKYDQVRQLIAMGKERGYLLYDEVNDILPRRGAFLGRNRRPALDLRALRHRCVRRSLQRKGRAGRRGFFRHRRSLAKEELAASEDGELDLTPGTLEKTNDPVRMYLREMGTVPLLTREGEVAIAKRIERGQLLVLKTITRAPLILKELLQVGEDLRNGSRSIKEIVQFDDEELTEEKIEAKTRETLKQIDKIAKLYLLAMKQAAKLERDSALEEAALPARALRAWRARASRCRS